MKRIVLFVISIAWVTWAPSAYATPNFPGEVQTHLSLAAPPPCSLCHANGVTGLGTVTTPFGTAMRANGLVPFDLAALDAALDALEAAKTDSDGDCKPDIEELKAGTDPNTPDGPAACASATSAPPPPTYGCELRIAAGTSRADDGMVALWVAAIGIFLVRRAKREARRLDVITPDQIAHPSSTRGARKTAKLARHEV